MCNWQQPADSIILGLDCLGRYLIMCQKWLGQSYFPPPPQKKKEMGNSFFYSSLSKTKNSFIKFQCLTSCIIALRGLLNPVLFFPLFYLVNLNVKGTYHCPENKVFNKGHQIYESFILSPCQVIPVGCQSPCGMRKTDLKCKEC